MATEVRASPFEEIKSAAVDAAGTAIPATGLACTTTRAYAILPKGTRHLFLTAHTMASSAAVLSVCLNPYLLVLKTTDGMATQPLDVSDAVQDGDTATVLNMNDFSTLANGDFLLVGSHLPFGGVYVDMGNTNAAGDDTVVTVAYWNGSSWVDISATDGTIATGNSFAADGAVTWTVPTQWPVVSLEAIHKKGGLALPRLPFYGATEPALYWTRWVWDVVFDAAVTVRAMTSINRNTLRFPLVSGQAVEMAVQQGPLNSAAVEAVTDTGTANLNVGVATLRSGRFT